MNRLDGFYFELEKAENELNEIETMTEDEVCEIYFVDSKAEAIKLIEEELASLNSDLLTEIERLESWD